MRDNQDSLPSLNELEQKLAKARKAEQAVGRGKATGMALRLGAEFASGVIVGVMIGMMLDSWLNTKPWMMITCIMFGAAAGIKTMLQTVDRHAASLEEDEINQPNE